MADAWGSYAKIADADDLVLKALRRNGQLAYVVRAGKMEKITEENAPWVKDLGDLGSHRYPVGWLADRYSWLDADGIPQKPVWIDVMTPSERAYLEQKSRRCQGVVGKSIHR